MNSTKSDPGSSRFKNMSPEKKLDLSMQLYYSAKELKKAALREFHPDWDETEVENELKRIFLHARS